MAAKKKTSMIENMDFSHIAESVDAVIKPGKVKAEASKQFPLRMPMTLHKKVRQASVDFDTTMGEIILEVLDKHLDEYLKERGDKQP